ncbi:DUF1729 domain-containing protein [Hoyosella sp. G463]|uniref:DUF1729 domain-containing protein n=1 Tax=Lolliginicoccus lacisalsi TaxID=2742202 RepID=A0A927PM60_9ACTN|nr:type I polyketide synthase [Lolliginicoccus lacisalsi]MBD8506046.1 DUF1729 domain-containing protein [Lolliginicoccus lacisalsi]
MTLSDHPYAREAATAHRHHGRTLVEDFRAGTRYAIAFGGQGSDWLPALAELAHDSGTTAELADLVQQANTLIAPLADDLLAIRPTFDPVAWLPGAMPSAAPGQNHGAHTITGHEARGAALSLPGILLVQLATLRLLALEGLDTRAIPPAATAGHSQGALAAEAVRHHGERDAEILAIAQLIGAAATLVGGRRGLRGHGEHPAMLSISRVDPATIERIVADLAAGLHPAQAPVLSLRNGRRRCVVSGPPAQLDRVRRRLAAITAEQRAERDARTRGGAILDPVLEPVHAEVAFHHPAMAEAVDLVADWAADCDLDVELARSLATIALVDPVDWVRDIEALGDAGATWILDITPGDGLARMTSSITRGLGIEGIAASTRGGHRNLFTPGAAPRPAPAWSTFAPIPIRLPNGRDAAETRFTRLTGRSPIILAGMTPTTVDTAIVAAAANAGHWSELAGGGQVTAEILQASITELAAALEPGRAAQFNALYLDPYLWKLQVGARRLLQKHREAGAPIDGITITAGIPELDEALALIRDLTASGITHIAFKPGTTAQIRAVIRIAAEVPEQPLIVQIEGGKAGGHHSWEDLDDLLLDTYAELRARPNIVIAVGGGIGTPERAAGYLTGTWSRVHGFPAMPIDAVLIGTAAMAAREATTSPDVKRLLVNTTGTEQWIGAGHATYGMASGRSQLGADIHEIDNAASRCGRLLDTVAGDASAVTACRDEIIAALAATAKPYFGDLATMTYQQWLERYIELTVGNTAPRWDLGTDLGAACDESWRSVWTDPTWKDRFAAMLRRAEARLNPQDRGRFASRLTDPTAPAGTATTVQPSRLEWPHATIGALLQAYPAAASTVLHPGDVPFFLHLCRQPGKPVPFVPIIDADVRRWWRSDSLWQAHDPRYTADQVCVIPGPVSVAGITAADEPIADILGRFETATFAALRAPATPAISRRRVPHPSPLGVLLAAPDVAWGNRRIANPLRRLAPAHQWRLLDEGIATEPISGATARLVDDRTVVLDVPMGRRAPAGLALRFTIPASCIDGGVPLVTRQDTVTGMRRLLRLAGGGPELPPAPRGTASLGASLAPEVFADHASVTALDLGSHRVPTSAPDALVGSCWPAIFAVLGTARTPCGDPVIEGLLDLVHLDHHLELVAEPPAEPTSIQVTATLRSVTDTTVGRVIDVEARIETVPARGVHRIPLATLRERFAIRHRTGTAPLDAASPVTAGEPTTTPRIVLRRATLTAPRDMSAFARISGDHNPIHTSPAAAALAGLDGPIVHGMWLSAAVQHLLGAEDLGSEHRDIPRITAWTARFLAPVAPGSSLDVTIERTGTSNGATLVEATCRVDGTPVLIASARLQPPRTAYAFPGQGIQHKGMGMAAMATSPAARAVWERADAHTRKALGFSVLAVVRDNPTRLRARGIEHHHPDGVLYLTQFTQVAMATLAVAQVATLRESEVLVDDAVFCGHSVGEYTALAAIAEVLPLEVVLEVVFRRGSAMHALVPRDADGRSDYRLAAIRPAQAGIADDDVAAFIARTATDTVEFLQVVNYNLRGSQYAIAGTVAGLEALEARIDERRAQHGGKRAFILVPGIDVPFHSDVLRPGVPEFRQRLEELVPHGIDPSVLIGRYIPNLVPRLFSLGRGFIAEIADLVDSEPLARVLENYEQALADPSALCRTVLIELLAWQFASPVRWIETQDLLFSDELGLERFIEIGVGAAPTLANLAAGTLRASDQHPQPRVWNCERDAALLLAQDAPEAAASAEPVASATAEAPQPTAQPTAQPAGPASATRDAPDLPYTAGDAAVALIALWTKTRPDQITPADTIEALCDGVSSRRNQVLLDLGAELGLGAIDGAAEASIPALRGTVERLARSYKPLGPVLADAVTDNLRRALGPTGKRPSHIADHVTGTWQLGPGWVHHVSVELALATREGSSARGGELATIDATTADAMVDAAITAVASRAGLTVAKPAATSSSTVDPAAAAALTEALTGPDGVLATTARHLLAKLGHDTSTAGAADDDSAANDRAILDLMARELGTDWPRIVAPAFDAARAVQLDDRWASAREDLARMWQDGAQASGRFDGAGEAVARQAHWWATQARQQERPALAEAYLRIAHQATMSTKGAWSGEIAVVTGASAGSIAAAVTAELLAGGATVIATTSRLDDTRLRFYRDLYQQHARPGATLWIVPANLASYSDVDALIDWIGTAQRATIGAPTTLVKSALVPTLLIPCAAPPVHGSLADAGPRAETQARVLLWSVERLIAGLGTLGATTDIDGRLHVVLPGSPNRGIFGGDGAYGEAKAALDAIVAKWRSERSWSQRITLVHALIGWVRGTGLMAQNDPLVDAVEDAGVRTWSATGMARALLEACTTEAREQARTAVLARDLTGGLAEADLDLAGLARAVADQATEADPAEETHDDLIAALPPAPSAPAHQRPSWGSVGLDPADMIVIVGTGELGPYGSSRTRHQMEVTGELSAAGVVELAWSTGLITWQDDPQPGWTDTATGDPVAEEDIADRYHDTILARCGIRTYEDDGALQDGSIPLLVSVYLDEDLPFTVGARAQAEAFRDADPTHTTIAELPSGEWHVTRKAGTEIRVPRRARLTRSVGAQIPTGFDPTRWGIPADMVAALDRVAVWNLITTVDAFLGSGFTPAELLRWVHPADVANTQGVGIGGMQSMRSLYVDALLGQPRPNDILQEALPNVIAAHVVQSYIGSYGDMLHPVAACATAAVSVSEATDKIRLGRASIVVAGGFDDLGPEGITGFGDMNATARTSDMLAKGIEPGRFSRANDRRRGGFVEAHGGGTLILARGDIAAELGLPVHGVIAWAGTFGDGIHTSIPAPGIGATSAARGRTGSELHRALAKHGLAPDAIAVISKHDTSTHANDPNESELHETIATALGRDPGNPMFVISQKTLTGHAKGGAAAFQMIGLCQVLRDGAIPPNRSLDCVDDVLAEHDRLVWPRQALRLGATMPLRAGLITSLGFGHVSALVAIAHPEAFLQALGAGADDYLGRATQRQLDGQRRLLAAQCGQASLYTRPADRRIPGDSRALETEMLLDPAARIGGGTGERSRAGERR